MQHPRVDESARSPFTGSPLRHPGPLWSSPTTATAFFLGLGGLATATESSDLDLDLDLDLGLGLRLELGGRPATRAGNATHEGVEMRMARGILSRSRSIGTQGHPAA